MNLATHFCRHSTAAAVSHSILSWNLAHEMIRSCPSLQSHMMRRHRWNHRTKSIARFIPSKICTILSFTAPHLPRLDLVGADPTCFTRPAQEIAPWSHLVAQFVSLGTCDGTNEFIANPCYPLRPPDQTPPARDVWAASVTRWPFRPPACSEFRDWL